MRILAFNNYDIATIAQDWEAEGRNAPSQHLWGCPELRALGHDVTYLPFAGSKRLKSLSRATRIFGDLDLQKRALRAAETHDVIYCAHQPTVAWLAMLRAAGRLKTPVVAVGYQSPRGTGPVARLWARGLVKGLDRLLCMSDAMEADFRALGLASSQMGQIRWGVDLRHYSTGPLPRGIPHFVSVGKSFRDFQTLIDGFPFDQAELTILGADRSLDVDLSNVPDGRLHIRGDWIDWREFVKILPGFHGMVLPIDMNGSRGNNAIGLTAVTEALACSVPVVATGNRYIGIDLAVEGVGHWVAPGDPEGWRRGVEAICADPDPLATRVRARELAETRINIETYAATLDAALRSVV